MKRILAGAGILFGMLLFSACAPWEVPVGDSGPRSGQEAREPQKKENDISPTSETLFQKAEEAYLGGEEKRALRLAEEAIATDETNYKAYSLKGLLLSLDGQPDAGAAEIQKALLLNPSYIQGYYEMGLAKKLGCRYEEAIPYFQRVIDVDPANIWSLYGIATCYADMRNREKALAYLKEAIKSGGDAVKDAAREQDHFAWLREDDAFKRLVR